jgi:hypothetical protein
MGLGTGFERERSMGSGITWTPGVSQWLRPRLTWSTTFSMRRDPNTGTLIEAGDGEMVLPRRLTNQQLMTAGTTFDLGTLIKNLLPDTTLAYRPRLRSVLDALMPIEAGLDRSVLSAFDRIAGTPSIGYQFAFGGVEHFRSIEDQLATSAGVTHTTTLGGGLRLPLGFTVTNRYRKVESRNWTRRFDDTHALVHTKSVALPDLGVRWSWRPSLLGPIVSSIGAQAGLRHVDSRSFVPTGLGGVPERSHSEVRQIPVSGSITWAFLNGLGTSASYTLTTRDEQRPGSTNESRTEDMAFDLSGRLPLPERLDLGTELRVRLGYQESRTESYVLSATTANRSRLTDNGRRAYSLNADTDVAENLTFSLQGSRVLTFDDNLGRRFTQTVFSAILQLQFQAGQPR